MSTLSCYLAFVSIYFDYCFAYENVALSKPAYQQYRYTGLSEAVSGVSNAVDGLKSDLSQWAGQCVISADGQSTATWWVNLTSILSIHHITIYYKTDNRKWGPSNGYAPRFLGFSLYVSNTTNKSDGTLCFKDTIFTTSTIPAVFNITCLVHGQYVIYYNERLSGLIYPVGYSPYAFNELCEVEVFGCPLPKYYGSDCSLPCPDPHCPYCQIETGTCQGCKPGFQGHLCKQACPHGFFGLGYTSICNYTCAGCNTVSGVCDRGCQPGWKGQYCHQPCPCGFFGWNCVNICNYTCAGCNSVSGLCAKGCLPGWKGEYCEEPCDGRKFGMNCTNQCGSCSHRQQCHHINGTCVHGCNPGFQGVTCIEVCDVGYFGENYGSRCGHCYQNETCHHIGGNCSQGCGPGYREPHCNDKCIQGKYGLHCAEDCGHCSDPSYCFHVNGMCLSGCREGFQGTLCKQVAVPHSSSIVWQTVLYGLLGVLCASFILIGILIALLRTSKRRSPHTLEKSENNGYQELPDINIDLSTYDALQ